jgi:hypothetical protein
MDALKKLRKGVNYAMDDCLCVGVSECTGS